MVKRKTDIVIAMIHFVHGNNLCITIFISNFHFHFFQKQKNHAVTFVGVCTKQADLPIVLGHNATLIRFRFIVQT